HNSAGCRELARTPAVKDHIACGISPDQDAVEYIVNIGQLAVFADKGRENARCQLAVRQLLCPSDEFDHSAPVFRVGHVLQSQVGDAFRVDRVGINVASKGQGGQDADFAAGIPAFHI